MRPTSKHWSSKMLNRAEQTTAPICMNPGLFCVVHVRREFLGHMHGARGILPIRPKHALEGLIDVATLVSATTIVTGADSAGE